MYDFNLLGTSMSFIFKIKKHIEANSPDRVKDYVCVAYDTVNPVNPKSHPCWDAIKDGIEFLRQRGWKVGVASWKNIGAQIIIQSPSGDYYHSSFKH